MSESKSKREQLIDALKSHDWYYGRSDDSRAYSKGSRSFALIQQLMREVEDGEALFEQYRGNRPIY